MEREVKGEGMMNACPIKGASDDCEDCGETAPESCIYVKTWKYIKSGDFAKDPGEAWKPFVRELQSSRGKAK